MDGLNHYSNYESNQEKNTMYLPKVKFEAIPIKNLVSSQEYQRGKSERHIKRAAENFDAYQINPIKVSQRDGINYVVNGQHTMEIVAGAGIALYGVWYMMTWNTREKQLLIKEMVESHGLSLAPIPEHYD